jgi:hypothetical protein
MVLDGMIARSGGGGGEGGGQQRQVLVTVNVDGAKRFEVLGTPLHVK